MICRLVISEKEVEGVIWITIKIGKTVIISHITQEMSNTNKEKQTYKQTNKQTNKKKKNLT